MKISVIKKRDPTVFEAFQIPEHAGDLKDAPAWLSQQYSFFVPTVRADGSIERVRMTCKHSLATQTFEPGDWAVYTKASGTYGGVHAKNFTDEYEQI